MEKYFSKKDLDLISKAVKEAENNTSGEIATAFIKQSDSYAIYELLSALIAGIVFFNILLLFYNPIEKLIQFTTWDYQPFYTVAFYGFASFVIIGLLYLLFNLPFFDKLIVPKKIMAEKVSNKALLHFIQSGVAETKDRTGILIFISYWEQRVELIADKGINEKISQDKWDRIVENLVADIKSKDMKGGLLRAIRACGFILDEHFPIKIGDVNELDNNITFLED